MGHRYHINLFWSDEDGCWIADVPDLTYCSAHGPTPEAALREVEVAVEAWLEAQAAEGRPSPSPRYRPAIYAGPRAA
jgi:predicted RNase H-like HicB family nuclease